MNFFDLLIMELSPTSSTLDSKDGTLAKPLCMPLSTDPLLDIRLIST